MPAPKTVEILARRRLDRECGQECVDWAIGMLEHGYGYDSKSLRALAGLTPPFHHFEMIFRSSCQRLTSKAPSVS